VLCVVHGPLVGPALFAEVIKAAGHELVEWEIASPDEPPSAPDAVLVLGGSQNVGEEESHPWLEHEYALLRGWVEAETPLLGICLGAQTLAHAFAAPVRRARPRQAGFREVELTAAGRSDPVVGVLPARFDALFANAYHFELPAGATELVVCPAGPQAYRLGRRAWALQFHPEAYLEQVLTWWGEEQGLPRPLDELAAELDAGIERWHALGRALCGAFLAVAAAPVA
jgi:GMP synthase-like glutamine amidotransferase